MTKLEEKKTFLEMKDWKERIFNKLRNEQWITVSFSERTEFEHVSFYCALVPKEAVEEVLKSTDWDLSYGHGTPRCYETGFGDQKTVIYERYGNWNDVEPLVIHREFHGIKDDYVEITEEFRHYHNLYHDQINNKFIKIYDSGEEEEVAVIEGKDIVRIKLKYIRQFLALKDMVLAYYFTIDRHTSESLGELGISEDKLEVENADQKYYFVIRKWNHGKKYNTHSRLMGKILIAGFSKEKSGIWPFEKDEDEYVEFIIGSDNEGETISYTSNPDELANYFGANPKAPHYLTPVFFEREVLSKYINQSEKYSVKDGYLSCGGLWGVQIDNNHDEYVSVFLGDLGRDMPYNEQLYWRSYNVITNEAISEVNFKRSFLAEFTDPQQTDLVLKSKYIRFRVKWEESLGWSLFKPLAEGDEHYLNSLRVPLTNDQAEIDKQILALSKLFVDAISVENLQRVLDSDLETKPIPLLESYLLRTDVKGYEPHTKFLRKMYELRSTGVGHRKGQNYTKVARYFQITDDNLISVMDSIMQALIVFLDFLIENCVSKEE